MIVVRYAVCDPGKAAERSRLIEEHKAYLRGATIRIMLSGPSAPPAEGRASTAVVIAEVETLAEFEAFSAGDPFVGSGVYTSVDLFEWRPTFGILRESFRPAF
ncbi:MULTISPECIES: YciI family protein [Rhizobium]|uniref:YciI family protein n=1 Tax=Rhizobium TaxID=379 RepID=UPI001B31972C|nr:MULTISPECIES: YciI family protein [Rhizobium]MBX4910095.1 YciI family protein [Rhizobium bangladeshense]MBX5217973.1 YciI family protein [Rhizobium sp. NLR9a]MBX5223919.1 YciI family protein [Rhizobium sp. NLR8a]MBX5229489.1 YciI family protein [Rhizobium sp. NLR9b]MBX5235730.1 YciI family protein [Rhizobium sp. NLR4a]